MKQYKVLRAEETWQRAGAYSVRVQGMNRQHHISLREEFDGHDGDESKYIVFWMIPILSQRAAKRQTSRIAREKSRFARRSPSERCAVRSWRLQAVPHGF